MENFIIKMPVLPCLWIHISLKVLLAELALLKRDLFVMFKSPSLKRDLWCPSLKRIPCIPLIEAGFSWCSSLAFQSKCSLRPGNLSSLGTPAHREEAAKCKGISWTFEQEWASHEGPSNNPPYSRPRMDSSHDSTFYIGTRPFTCGGIPFAFNNLHLCPHQPHTSA